MEKLLRRTTSDKVFAGVCGGLGKFFAIDPIIWRLIFLLGTIFGLGSFILVYIVMWIVIPKEQNHE